MNTYWDDKLDMDIWFPANGGTETPFTGRLGHPLLYCYNPKQDKHAYLDLTTDMILTDEDAQYHFLGVI